MKKLMMVLLLFAEPLLAGAERRVEIEEVTLRASKQRVVVTLRQKPEGKFEVDVEFYGKKTTVRSEDLPEVKTVYPDTAKIVTHTPTGGELDPEWLRDRGFILSFDYGKVQEHGSDKDYVLVNSRCRIHFDSKGEFTAAELLVPTGNLENKWKCFEKFKGQAPTDSGTTDGVKAPVL